MPEDTFAFPERPPAGAESYHDLRALRGGGGAELSIGELRIRRGRKGG